MPPAVSDQVLPLDPVSGRADFLSPLPSPLSTSTGVAEVLLSTPLPSPKGSATSGGATPIRPPSGSATSR